ncbi:GGDEF domain-containing protein [Salipiger sp. IMCC34102]|uniref:GGDEF domain-containing protein n=1 Tax=Salipiger sp. IMCC34102 TaxID=2510647 RepID=UPI00101C287A|nr:GGDEF domain-containing protein [Salipiger sp. IMCC34102]RYH03298.1 GGDEF domain-containing protein [Salipiger sp. IMCC34102]
MIRSLRDIPLVLLRLATPTGRISALLKFMAFNALIYVISVALEYGLTGTILHETPVRVAIIFGTSTPFILLLMFGFSVARQSNARLANLAATDPMTRLPNRRAFFDGIAESRRTGARGYLAILDADRFKTINDTLGHDAGDRALLAVADWMRRRAGPELLFARIGGEEFGVLATGASARSAIDAIETDLCPNLCFGLQDEGPTRSLTLSAGVVVFDPDLDPHDMLREADAALYRSKIAGGARLTRSAARFHEAAPNLSPKSYERSAHRATGAGA